MISIGTIRLGLWKMLARSYPENIYCYPISLVMLGTTQRRVAMLATAAA